MAYTNNSLLQLQLCNNYYQALQYCQVGVGNVYPHNIYPARWRSLSRPSGFVCRSQLVGHHLTNARLQRIPIPSRRLSDIIPTQAPLHQLRTVSSNLNHFQSRFQMPTNCPTNGQRSSLLSVTTPSFSVLPDPTMHDSVSTVADKSHSVTACSPLSYLAPESDSSSLPVSAETEVTVTAASPETCHTNIDIKLQFHFPVVANSVKKNSERCGVSCSSVPNSPDSLSGDGNESQYIVIDSDEFSDSEFVPEILLPFSEDSDCLSPTVDLHSTSTNNVNITNIIADSKLPVFPESDSQFRSEMASSVRITSGGVEQCEVSSSVSDSPKDLPAVQAVVTDATVQPKPLSKSQRQCRSKAIKRAAKLASIVNNLSPSVQQASKVRPCAVTGNSEAEESTCSDRGQMQKDSSEASTVVTVSTQSASPKECFCTSSAVMSNDNKGIFSSISTGGTDSTDIIVIDDDENGNTADTVSNNDTVDSDLPVITNSASDVTRHDVMSTVKSDVVPTSEDFVVIDSADDITSAKTEKSLLRSQLKVKAQVCNKNVSQLRRPHPYRNAKQSWKYSNLTEMMQCHTVRSNHAFPHPPVNQNVFMEHADFDKLAFSSYAGFQRSTPADVERIFKNTALLHVEDDHTDADYTADDVECFDERKRLAEELDNMI